MKNQTFKGYRTTNFVNSVSLETLYAVSPEGDVYCSEEKEVSDRFNEPGTNWSPIDQLPREAEFIGNYVDTL